MKSSSIVSFALATLATAIPVELAARQVTANRNELINGACQDITFIFARGSTELPNLGTLGAPLGNTLDANNGGRVAQQGVNYAAALSTNLIGGDPAGIAEAARLFNLAHTKCPNSIIVAGGYSQGAALMHRSIALLSSAVLNQIAGVVTFGDTYNAQDRGTIPELPKEKVKVICRPDDGVCYGTLTVTAGHLAYAPDVGEAAAFLQSRIQAAS